MDPVTIVGNPVSPYVRKVLAACALKGVEVQLDPIVGLMGNDDFDRISPLRRIPVWVEGEVTLCDSSVIVQYIEETRPGPSLWPADPVQRAKARWLEEFADTRLFDILGWNLFFEIAVKPRLLGGEIDQARVEQARDVDLPVALDYLEGWVPGPASCSATCQWPISASPPPSSTPARCRSMSIPPAGRSWRRGWSGSRRRRRSAP